MKKQTKKVQFSLVEVIVVVAIILTLFSIMLSAIKTSNDLSKKVTCMSNIAQIRAYTELYRKDHGQLPYSDIWLTDFSYAKDYMSGTDGLSVFICPGSQDEKLTSTDQLSTSTSYYYVPTKDVLNANLADGQIYGFNLLNLNALNNKDQLVIYDKSPDHHNGKINIAYLYNNDLDKHKDEGKILASSADTVLALDGSGQLVLEDSETFGRLNLNPGVSNNVVFTLTDRDGNIITIRTDSSSSEGTAINITLKVKNTARELTFGDDSVLLATNTDYDITAVGDTGITDPYFIYKLTHEGQGQGNWYLDLFQGSGGIKVTNKKNGTSVTLGL